MPEYQFPPLAKRKVMGKGYARIEGPEKASGRAKYTSDYNKPNQLWGAVLTCPLAHCRVKSVDTGAAEKMKGVTAVRVTAAAGTEIQWAGWEVAFVAAESEQIARDAVRTIRVDYEPMPFVVNEDDLKKAGSRAKPAGEQIEGDPDQALKSAEVVSEGEYGIPTITHCCLESHGQVVAWSGDKVEYNPSTQSLTPIQGDLARQLNVPAANVHTHQDHIGGGFGSKFQSDRWGVESAHMSKASGGRPVKLYLDRATEQVIAGCRPSAFAKIKVGGQKDGTITAWESISWASGGVGGRHASDPVRADQDPKPAAEPYGRVVEHCAHPCLARSQPSAGVVPHLQRDRRFRRQDRNGSAGGDAEEHRPHAAARSLRAATEESR